jgi:hypothetical protein
MLLQLFSWSRKVGSIETRQPAKPKALPLFNFAIRAYYSHRSTMTPYLIHSAGRSWMPARFPLQRLWL